MSESDKSEELRAFYLRASEAEERLSKLEVSLASKKEGGDEELLKVMQKLEEIRAEQKSERELAAKEIQKLTVEHAKQQYRIIHLCRTVSDLEAKLNG